MKKIELGKEINGQLAVVFYKKLHPSLVDQLDSCLSQQIYSQLDRPLRAILGNMFCHTNNALVNQLEKDIENEEESK